MGAYAALKYSAALGLDIVVAYSPQWSIAPQDIAPLPCQWSSDYLPELHDSMRITTADIGESTQVFAFYDPWDPLEALHASKLREACKQFYPIHMTNMGHHVALAMAGSELFSRILAAVKQGTAGLVALRQIGRTQKKTSEYYLFNVLEKLWRLKHYGSFQALIKKYAPLHPRSMHMLMQVGRLQSHLKDWKGLTDAMQRADELAPSNPQVYARWGVFALDMGRHEKSVELLDKALTLSAGDEGLQQGLRYQRGLALSAIKRSRKRWWWFR